MSGKTAPANHEIVDAFVSLAEDAADGKITDYFVLIRDPDGEYDSLFFADDLGDMILQLRTEVIRAQAESQRIDN